MKQFAWLTLLLGQFLAANLALAADATKPPPGDDLLAQGRLFQAEGKTSAALWAYRQSAKSGNVDGAAAAGQLLFALGRDRQTREQVLQVAEGMKDLFYAATNRQPQACRWLAEGLAHGIGVASNQVSAYAWLLTGAQSGGAFQPELDRLVVRLKPEEIFQAQETARSYLAGHWPTNLIHPVAVGDPRLLVQGLSQDERGALVVLNGSTLAAGESADVPPAADLNRQTDKRLIVSCRRIGSDYLLVAVNGEPDLKLLPIKTR